MDVTPKVIGDEMIAILSAMLLEKLHDVLKSTAGQCVRSIGSKTCPITRFLSPSARGTPAA